MESILLFLIIGAILNFLQRGKEQDKKREAPRTGTPRTEGKQHNEIDWREILRQEAEPVPKNEREQSYTSIETKRGSTFSDESRQRSNELLEKYEIAKQNKKTIEKPIGKKLMDSPIYKNDLTAKKQVRLDFSKITKEEAIKGVVWSEILGKPRAKGSYRPSLNTRRKQG